MTGNPSTCLAVAAAGVAFLSPTPGLESSLSASSPENVYELQDAFSLEAEGRDLLGSIRSGGAWLDGRDVTQDIVVRLLEQEATDRNGDGVLEVSRANFQVELDGLETDPGQLLELELVAQGAKGRLAYRTSSRILANVEIQAPESASILGEPLVACVAWAQCASMDRALELELDGDDVSGLVGILSVRQMRSPEHLGGTLLTEALELDLSGLVDLAEPGSVLTIRGMATSVSRRSSQADASTVLWGTSAPDSAAGDAGVQKALQDFVDAMGITKQDGGSVTSSRDPKTVNDAVDALQQALRVREVEIVSGTFTLKDSNGKPIEVKVLIRSTGDASLSGEADVVIAIGGDGTGSAGGGDGSASNTKKGGAAIGHGGDGGSSGTSAGKGGNGSATAKSGPNGSPSGTAIGGGGRGGAPTNGGMGANGGSASSSNGSGSGTSGSSAGGGAGGPGAGGAGAYSNTRGSNSSSGLYP